MAIIYLIARSSQQVIVLKLLFFPCDELMVRLCYKGHWDSVSVQTTYTYTCHYIYYDVKA